MQKPQALSYRLQVLNKGSLRLRTELVLFTMGHFSLLCLVGSAACFAMTMGQLPLAVPAAAGDADSTQQASILPLPLQISEGFSEGILQSGSVKPPVPPHALALYQQQITKAHESSREDVPPSKQQEKEQQQPSSSPRGKSRSPTAGDKEGRAACWRCVFICEETCCAWPAALLLAQRLLRPLKAL